MKMIRKPDSDQAATKGAIPASWKIIKKMNLKSCKTKVAVISTKGSLHDVQLINKSPKTIQENPTDEAHKLFPVDHDLVKKALLSARKTSRFAEIARNARAHKVLFQEVNVKSRKTQEVEAAKKLKRETRILERERIEKEKEEVRVALRKMKPKVDLQDDNHEIMKELEELSGCSPDYVYHHSHHRSVVVFRGLKSGKIVDPLARIGLRIKDEFL